MSTQGNFSDVKAIHEEGFITLVTDKSGKSKEIISSGVDGGVWKWQNKCFFGPQKPLQKSIGDRSHACVAWKGDEVFVGYTTSDLLTKIDKQVVGKFKISGDQLEPLGSPLSFSLDVTSVDVSNKFLVAGSSDSFVKRASLVDESSYDRFECQGVVLCVSISPSEDVFAVSTSDGVVSIFPTEGTERVAGIAKMFPSFSDIDSTKPRVHVAWSQNGERLFVPSVGSVKQINSADWALDDYSFKHPKILMSSYSVCCVSACGEFLAAATLTGQIVVWRIADRSFVTFTEFKRASSRAVITAMVFDPLNPKNLVIADDNEGICVLQNATVERKVEEKKAEPEEEEADNIEDMDDDDDDEDDIVLQRERTAMFDDEADDDGNTNQSFDLGAIKKKHGFDENNEPIPNFAHPGAYPSAPLSFGGASVSKSAPVVERYRPPVLPDQFVSASSPKDIPHRYLKWNSYGVVRSSELDDGSNIEVEFHDTSISPEILMDNSQTRYELADLSDKAVVLASKEKKTASEMLVIHIASWDMDSRRWEARLPIGDGAVDVLATREMIAIITETRNVRVFTLAGTQRHIISHPAPILTAAAFDSRISIVSLSGGAFFDGSGEPQWQHSLTCYDVSSSQWYRGGCELEKTRHLAITPGEKLRWISHTNKGQVVTMDSKCVVRVMCRGGAWMPVFNGYDDLRASSDSIWPISVMEAPRREFRYIYCRGEAHPRMSLKLAPTVAKWLMPLINPESERTREEEELLLNELRQSVATRGSTEFKDLLAAHDRILVKLFAAATQANMETRASELAHLAVRANTVQMMCNYATKKRRQQLSEKVASIGQQLDFSSSNAAASAPSSAIELAAAPRKVMLRKSVMGAGRQVSVPDEPIDMNASTASLDVSLMESESSQPVRSNNPFKRSADTSRMDTSSVSVFDQLDASFDSQRKRMKENEEPSRTPRQSKLSFLTSDKSVTPFDLWLEENEMKMQKEFSGNEEDFSKFCTNSFRQLSKTEKQEWKTRAEVASK